MAATKERRTSKAYWERTYPPAGTPKGPHQGAAGTEPQKETEMQHILSLSYGKDSLACLGAIEKLGWPLDRIVHAEVWATDTIPADLPPMVEFKAKADAIIKARWGIEVEHVCAMRDGKKLTYEKQFYTRHKYSKNGSDIHIMYGWPHQCGAWCNSRLKVAALNKCHHKGAVSYRGIAIDEPIRLARLDGVSAVSPLAAAGWTEAMCRIWCEENDLLSPIYTHSARGGCWFCQNQSIGQLRLLRKSYPEYWALMLKWDSDSPVTFHPDGHTVHDFDLRFQLEDEGFLSPDDKKFRWSVLEEELNYRWF